MSIAIVGCKGSMGKRYSAILRGATGIDVHNIELLDTPYTHVVIATPTDTHEAIIERCLSAGSENILCEKPLSTRDVNYGPNVRMVCNWRYVDAHFILDPGGHVISYDYYNWGRNDDCYDVLQPIYFASTLTLAGGSPVFQCVIDGRPYTQQDFDHSYVLMIRDWLSDNRHTLTCEQANEAIHKAEAFFRLPYER